MYVSDSLLVGKMQVNNCVWLHLPLKEMIVLGVRYNPTQIQIGSFDKSTFASVYLANIQFGLTWLEYWR